MILLPFIAAAGMIATGDDLLATCTADEGRKACAALVLGVANGAMLAAQDAHQKVLCPPVGVRSDALILTVRKYLDAHPETRSKPAPVLAYQALKAALPCSQG